MKQLRSLFIGLLCLLLCLMCVAKLAVFICFSNSVCLMFKN